MDKLKTCPFCGGTVSITLEGNDWHDWWRIGRTGDDTCICNGFMDSKPFNFAKTDGVAEKEKLIEDWNRRVAVQDGLS